MKRLVKILAAVTAAASLVISVPKITAYADGYTCVHGYRTFGDYTLNSGVRNRYFLIESSLYNAKYATKYGLVIGKASSDWKDKNSKVSITQAYEMENKKAIIRFQKRNLGAGILGQTEHYQTFTLPSPVVTVDNSGKLTGNYSWAYIYLNVDTLDILYPRVEDMSPIVAHEMGHAMGLSHRNNNPTSIMCQTGSGRTAMVPATIDSNTINHLYN